MEKYLWRSPFSVSLQAYSWQHNYQINPIRRYLSMFLITNFTNLLAEGQIPKYIEGSSQKKGSKIWSGDTLLPTMPQWKQINYLLYVIATISLLSIAIYIYVALEKQHLIFYIVFLELFVAFCTVKLHISDIFFCFPLRAK